MRRPRRGGFTLLELVIVICIVAVCAGVLLHRLLYYQERAERARMEQIAVVTRSALQLRVAGLIVAGRSGEIEKLNDENPMDWLADRPSNYLGPLYDPDARELPKGSWYFDTKAHHLVYVLNRSKYFEPGADDELRIRFRVDIEVKPSGRPGVRLPGQVTKVGFHPVVPYVWFPDEKDVAQQLLK